MDRRHFIVGAGAGRYELLLNRQMFRWQQRRDFRQSEQQSTFVGAFGAGSDFGAWANAASANADASSVARSFFMFNPPELLR